MAVGEVGGGRRVGAKLPLSVLLTPLLLLLASPSPAHGHASGTSLLSNCIFTANVTSPNVTSANVTSPSSVDPPNIQPNVATDLTVRLSVRVELSEDYAGRAGINCPPRHAFRTPWHPMTRRAVSLLFSLYKMASYDAASHVYQALYAGPDEPIAWRQLRVRHLRRLHVVFVSEVEPGTYCSPRHRLPCNSRNRNESSNASDDVAHNISPAVQRGPGRGAARAPGGQRGRSCLIMLASSSNTS